MTVTRWGILGAARFALNHMGPAIHMAKGAELVALATGSPEKAAAFQAFAPRLRVETSYESLLAAEDIDAVYIPLPNHLHVAWTQKALAAGKHVLCEKPIAMQAPQIDALINARDASGLLAAEAYMIVHHPQMQRARALLQEGAIGRLVHVEGTFTYFNDDPANFRNQASAGGGGLPDIGVYTIGATRFLTGKEPVAIDHADIRFENGVDVFAHFSADFSDFTMSSTVSMRMYPRQEMVLHGEKGVMRLTCPFNPSVFDLGTLTIDSGQNRRVTERWTDVNQYVLQVENFGNAVQNGAAYPCPLEFSRGTQKMMDMVFAKAAANT